MKSEKEKSEKVKSEKEKSEKVKREKVKREIVKRQKPAHADFAIGIVLLVLLCFLSVKGVKVFE